ncbi:uncharacterized protein [Spinacia oleracea]|uniref:Uncharacterized protein isoform X1 n=1 Tax=Spinacia oleracea TaxID=3562 RepID=A0ABM3QNP8_SPIOL|nr:uncharacterized protein LOC110805057 isoform X1 [Spinacia oleracea]
MENEGKFVMITEDNIAEFGDKMILVPERIPIRFVFHDGGGNSGGGSGGGITTFKQLKEKFFNVPELRNPYDCQMRNQIRNSYWNQIQKFGGLEELVGKKLVFFQLVLVDEHRDLQEKLFQGISRLNPEDPNVAECSRNLFKAHIPHLLQCLQDSKRWVYSRSLVIKEYNRALLDDTLLSLLSNDPVGGLRDIAFDIPFGTPDSEVDKQLYDLMKNPVKEYKDTPMPLGIHCTEVLMFLAGDFALDNAGGLNSRNAVVKLLRYLNTEDGIQKIHGFDEMAAGCPKVSPEKIMSLKDVHLTS